MADPFVAEIRIFPFNFAPKGWAWCDGQLLPLSQNTALFSLLGTTYGGDGKSNFALPDLQGSAPMHPGQGPGLSLARSRRDRRLGDRDAARIGNPGRTPMTSGRTPTQSVQQPAPVEYVRASPARRHLYVRRAGNLTCTLSDQTLAPAGGNQPHNNLQPYLTCYFCIALQGVFPPRP